MFLLHAGFVFLYPHLGMATNQWQDNLVKAQSFLYTEHADTVMVGSSLSARIIKDSIPTVSSISFGGCSVEDGLMIVQAKKQKPQYILVETNYFLRVGNPELVNDVTKGVIPEVKKFIPSLREQNEPICLVSGLLIHAIGLNPQAAAASVDMNFLSKSINDKIKSDSLASNRFISQRMHILLPLFKQLERQGINFIFFEMPVNPKLTNLSTHRQTRQLVNKLFPKASYAYLPFDNACYVTTDGEHLNLNDQYRFSHFFKLALQTSMKISTFQGEAPSSL